MYVYNVPCSQHALILVLEHVGNFGVRLHPGRNARFCRRVGWGVPGFVGEWGGEC